jgi:hypothetical protein
MGRNTKGGTERREKKKSFFSEKIQIITHTVHPRNVKSPPSSYALCSNFDNLEFWEMRGNGGVEATGDYSSYFRCTSLSEPVHEFIRWPTSFSPRMNVEFSDQQIKARWIMEMAFG